MITFPRGVVCVCVAVLLSTGRLASSAEVPAEAQSEDLETRNLAIIGELDVDVSRYSTKELIAEAAKLVSTVKDIRSADHSEELTNSMDTYFQTACDRADEPQLRELFEIYGRLPLVSMERINFLPFLARRWIQHEVVQIREEHVRVSLPEVKLDVPTGLSSAPRELVEAWQLYQRAKLKYDKSFQHPWAGEKIEAYLNIKTFYKLVETAFLKGQSGLEKELQKYSETGANCMGVTEIEDAKDFAILAVLLRQRRLDEAIGAAFRVSGTEGSISSPEVSAGAIVELLKACELDWEKMFIGAQVATELRGWDYGSPKPFLDAVAGHGSGRAGVLLNQLAHFVKSDSRTQFVEIFNSWIEDSPAAEKCDGDEVEGGYRGHKREKKGEIPKEIQTVLLGTTEEFATSNCPEQLAKFAINTFARTQARSSIPALRQLTLHSSVDVAASAAKVLCAMGERVPMPAIGAPVRFRVSINGQPLPPGFNLEGAVVSESSRAGSAVAVVEDGIVALERRLFTNQTKLPTKVSFSAFGGESSDPQFDVEIPVPASLDSLTPVEIKAGSLQLDLKNVQHLNAPLPRTTVLYILPHRGADLGTSFSSFGRKIEVPVGKSIIIPTIRNDIYDVGLSLPGAEAWHGQVVVGPGQEPIQAKLRPGSDVRCKIIAPNGEETFGGTLIKEGKKLDASPDYDTKSYRALGCANYVLKIFGSGQWTTRETKAGPDEIPFLGRDIPFTVSEGSPAIIDLGEIRLEAAPN